MIFISYRKDFWSDRHLTEHDAIREINLQTGVETEITEAKFTQRIKGKRIKLLVHGYRNSRLDVLCAYGQLNQELTSIARGTTGAGPQEYHEVIGILWPGHDWRVEFSFAKAKADAVASKFFARLSKMAELASVIDVMTHSLGARVALRALQNAGPASTPIRNLFLTAPAIDDESIEQNEKFFFATERCGQVFVLHSRKDPVLEFFYPIPFFGGGGPALGFKGPKRPSKVGANVSVIDSTAIATGHSEYRKRGEVYEFVQAVVKGNSVPTKLTVGTGILTYDCPFEIEGDD